ncbi:MAG: hypothetical protein ACFFD4_34350 [Candidatus Odinarchaeota archaeon]
MTVEVKGKSKNVKKTRTRKSIAVEDDEEALRVPAHIPTNDF